MMTRTLRAVLSFVLLFVLIAQPALAAPKQTKVEVTFVSAELVENDHVGNEWATGASVNGKTIKEGESLVLAVKANGSISLKANAEEQDKYPDKGTTSQSVKVSSITAKASEKVLNVTVTENRGRYSGNKAKWKFIFSVKTK
ncbi:hypothetical protein [Paenibacillus taiwanensis]|uniref:hypothetical protein n=1 Tax=Paenibacillus taiwanensis TaxID=401638 RepID=UPI00048E1C14|nr:hypothetical protein [Paenibacillus taiwanensis]